MSRILFLTSFILLVSNHALADTFGGGSNSFDIDFVTIGNPGNAADTTGTPNPAGKVDYFYRIGTYEVSRDMISKASTSGNLGITLADMTSFGGNGVDRPATGVSWYEAARFVNWLNTSKGFSPAYKFALQPGDGGYSANDNIQLWTPSDAGYNPNNLYRNSLAFYFLPSDDEWYKAAYYDPTSGNYFDYPTGSNSFPTPVASGTAAGTAVYNQAVVTGPANITLAGGLSPYGTMGQAGNVWEWEETDLDLLNGSGSSTRGVRGGDWDFNSFGMRASDRSGSNPISELSITGFRVASSIVPEPSTIVLTLGIFAPLAAYRRRKSVPHTRV